MLVGSVVILAWMSVELVVLLCCVLIINGLFLRYVRPRIECCTRSTRERGSDVAAFFVEILGLTKCVQMFNGQAREHNRLAKLHDSLREANLRLQVIGYLASAVPGLVMSLSIAGVFLVGGYSITEGTMTLGVLIAFVTYMQRASSPAQSLLGLYVAYQRARVSLGRVRELSSEVPAVSTPTVPGCIVASGQDELILDNLSFRYPGTDNLVFSNLTWHVPAGSRVFVRGPSGSGKSTLVDLLQRHFDPDTGCILLGGKDIRCYDLKSLRDAVVVVSQDTQLFSCSLLDNIRYGQPKASDDAVMEAARVAGVDEFVKTLPEGYQTPLGPRGIRLSGGQRQRVALARAILLQPSVLIFDESTTGIDTDQEARIHREIDRLFAGRTRIFISHRALGDEKFDIIIDIGGGYRMESII